MWFGRVVAAGAVAAMAGRATGEPSGQKVTGPVATYWMSASTSSGMMGMGMGGLGGGGRRPSFGALMMGGDFGGGMDPNAYTHSLILQLGSARKPQAGGPQAEHDAPPALGSGPVLPLLTPVQQPAHEERAPEAQFEKPKGRMLIFWGCGGHAGPNQPMVIDVSRIGPQGQGAAQFAALSHGLAISPMQPPSPGRNVTYGEWPNQQTHTQLPRDGSLQGAHMVKGNYTPDINFSLTADQDFLPPVRLNTNAKTPSGSVNLGWGQVDGSRGFIASMFGAKGEGDVVIWTSSAIQATAFALPDYLSDQEIERLVGDHVLMPPTQLSCTVPQEAVRAAGGGMLRLIAYGGESNISYPPRPAAPRSWNIDWTVKVRYRAETSGLLGMSMSDMGGGHDRDDDGEGGHHVQGRPNQQQHRPNPFSPFGGLGGFIP
jgi:hypothetical protein